MNRVYKECMIFGYARVSTEQRIVAVQLDALAHAVDVRVFRETASGAKTDRAQPREALAGLAAGNVRTVTRLARLTRDLLNDIATITDSKAGLRLLGDTWANTTTQHVRLMLTALGGSAEFERDLMRCPMTAGRARTKTQGMKMGRPPRMTTHQVKEAPRRRDADESMRELTRSHNVSHSTISRIER